MVSWAKFLRRRFTTSTLSNLRITPLLVPHFIGRLVQECRAPDQFEESLAPDDTDLVQVYFSYEGNHEMQTWLSPRV